MKQFQDFEFLQAPNTIQHCRFMINILSILSTTVNTTLWTRSVVQWALFLPPSLPLFLSIPLSPYCLPHPLPSLLSFETDWIDTVSVSRMLVSQTWATKFHPSVLLMGLHDPVIVFFPSNFSMLKPEYMLYNAVVGILTGETWTDVLPQSAVQSNSPIHIQPAEATSLFGMGNPTRAVSLKSQVPAWWPHLQLCGPLSLLQLTFHLL